MPILNGDLRHDLFEFVQTDPKKYGVGYYVYRDPSGRFEIRKEKSARGMLVKVTNKEGRVLRYTDSEGKKHDFYEQTAFPINELESKFKEINECAIEIARKFYRIIYKMQ